MKKADGNLLGGIFKWPNFRDLKDRIRGKLGYLPREDTIENPIGYHPDPRTDPPIMPSIYPILRFRLSV